MGLSPTQAHTKIFLKIITSKSLTEFCYKCQESCYRCQLFYVHCAWIHAMSLYMSLYLNMPPPCENGWLLYEDIKLIQKRITQPASPEEADNYWK